MLLLLVPHNVPFPSIVVFLPSFALPVGVKDQRSSLSSKVEVEMHDVAQWEYEDVSGPELDDKA
jgi:hypothetical protein